MPYSISTVQSLGGADILQRLYRVSTLLARRGETGEAVFWLAIFATIIGVICGISYAATQLANKWRYNSHPSLFSSLCRLHDIDHNTRAMLKQVIRHHGLTQPARLFTEPEWLDPAKLGKPFEAKAKRLQALRMRLFAIEKKPAKS